MAMRMFLHASRRSARYLRQIPLDATSRLFCQQQQFPLGPSAPLLPLWSSVGIIKFTSNGNDSGNGLLKLDASKGIPKFNPREQEDGNRKHRKPSQRKKLKSKRAKLREGKGKKKKLKFPNPEVRIKYKIEKAKNKEALLTEKLKQYEIPKSPNPAIEPERLTSEERFYLKRMGQKYKNYVPVGKRGVFGGVILNMHLHWKKHETVKVICKHCKPGQIHQYAEEIARLSGGIVIHIKGEDTIIFYRGKNYVQPKVMLPKDTLSKRKALQKAKLEQSLDSVRRFIAISEKELEIYYRHIALYGDPDIPVASCNSADKGNLSDDHLGQEGVDFKESGSHGLKTESFGESSTCIDYTCPLLDSSTKLKKSIQSSLWLAWTLIFSSRACLPWKIH